MFEKHSISNAKLKVMHITYDMRIGGTETVIKNIINGSDKNKYDMSILCIESPLGPFAQQLQNEGVQFFELNRRPGFDTTLIKSIRNIIQCNNIDIVHCHQYTPWVYGVIASAFSKAKVIFTEHGRFYPDFSTRKRQLVNPLLNLFTDQVTAISNATKQALVKFENIREKSIDVIYNGIIPPDIDQAEVERLRKALNLNQEQLILGTIARFDPIKNHTMMLKAFAEVLTHHPNTLLIIVGDGEERKNIETCIQSLNITENVILTGYQVNAQSYLALMDIYLLSSFSEGTSMTLLEAMALSKPCVVTNVGGNPEVIKDKFNGFVTGNDNAAEFASAILKLMQEDIRATQSKNALKNFNAAFTAASMNAQYAKVYSAIKPH